MKRMLYHARINMVIKDVPLLFFIVCSFTLKQSSQAIEEYKLKAAFIYNFTKFIDWNFLPGEDEFAIGIIGSSPINEALAEIARAKTANNRTIIIRQFDKPEEIRPCQILFISKNNTFPLAEILAKTAKGTLTISEKEGYAIRGTAINFINVNNKLKFEANKTAISLAGLTASSQLLKLAVLVE